MDRFVNHDDFIELLGAYALDALDPDEAEAVRLHLEECPRCTEEVAQYHQVAALLGNGGGDAPTHLWDEIAEKIEALHPADGSLSAPTPIRPVPGAGRSPSSARVGGMSRRVVLLGAAAAVVVVALLSLQVSRLNDRVGSLNASSASTDLSHLVQAALANPAAQKVDLASATVASATDAEVVIMPTGSAYLVNKGLPPLPSDQTYQLWGRTGTQLISLGVLGNRPTNAAFSVGPSATYRAYLVTAERAGGVVKTTHQPVAESSTLST
jgi:anti-sigma factor RsiW